MDMVGEEGREGGLDCIVREVTRIGSIRHCGDQMVEDRKSTKWNLRPLGEEGLDTYFCAVAPLSKIILCAHIATGL